ncbi:hypothetical protein EMIT043CA1_30287 [Pseudomonas brassicacearum]
MDFRSTEKKFKDENDSSESKTARQIPAIFRIPTVLSRLGSYVPHHDCSFPIHGHIRAYHRDNGRGCIDNLRIHCLVHPFRPLAPYSMG